MPLAHWRGGVSLEAVVRFLDSYLRVRSIQDVAGVVNGLQRRNAGQVQRLVAAVDCSPYSIAGAASAGASLLLVHHGLSTTSRTDEVGSRCWRDLRRSDVALYSCHIPLDLHPAVGNNVILGRMLGLKRLQPFGRYGRRRIGMSGRTRIAISDLIERLDRSLGTTTYAVRGGPSIARRVAVVTGNGTRWITEAARSGVDTLVTGEAGHHDALRAEELGLNLVCAGHYATETFGVKALSAELSDRFDLPWAFFDHPTGL